MQLINNTEGSIFQKLFYKHPAPAIWGHWVLCGDKKLYQIDDTNESFETLSGISRELLHGLFINRKNKSISPKAEKIIQALQIAVENRTGILKPGYYCSEEKCYRIDFTSIDENFFMYSFSDISVEKEQINESESFFELIPDLLSVIGDSQQLLKINSAWERLLGYKKSEILERKFTDNLHPDDVNEWHASLNSIKQHTGISSFTNRIFCKNGEYRFFEWRVFAYGNKLFTAARDITNRIEKNTRLEHINSFSNDLLQLYSENENIDALLRKLIEYSGATFCALNQFNESTKEYSTVSVIGDQGVIKAVENILGFRILGRRWQYNPLSDTPFNKKESFSYKSFLEIPRFIVPGAISRKLQCAIPVGNIAAIRIKNQNSLLADIIFFTPRGVEIKLFTEYEVYLRQITLFLKGISTEQAFRRSEAQLRQIIDMVPHFIFAKDIYGKFILANKAVASAYGTTPEDLIGKTDSDFVKDKKQVNHFRSDDLKVIKSGKELFIKEEVLRTENQPDKVLQTIKIPFTNYNDTDKAVLGASTDITERVLAEKKVLNSEARLRTIIEMAADTILLGSADGRIVGANDQAEILTGYTKEEITKMRIEDLFAVEELSRVPMRYDLLMEGKSVRSERLLKRKDAQLIPIEMNTRVMPDRSLHSILRDIEEIKRVQNELIAAKEKAEENDRLKSAFLSNMSHEIRTPMNAIVGFSNLLTDPGTPNDKKTYYSEIIDNNCKSLLRIIDDVLDISKIESGQMKIVNASCNVNAVLEKLHDMLSELISKEKNNVSVNFDKPESVIEVITDETRLFQVMLNLLNNAVNFTEKGRIDFGVKIMSEYLQFYVKDTGIGIAKELHQKIFERFYRHSGSLSKTHRGTGLGLTICKSLIELMGGNIMVDSELGKGTCMSFTIPYLKPVTSVEPGTFRVVAANPDFADYKILVVEDDQASLEYLLAVLRKIGFRFINIAHNGNTAVEAAIRETYDVILMDIQLPDISGIEATKRILKHDPAARIIAQTAYAMQNDKDTCTREGCIDYIAKPIKINELSLVLSKHLVKSL